MVEELTIVDEVAPHRADAAAPRQGVRMEAVEVDLVLPRSINDNWLRRANNLSGTKGKLREGGVRRLSIIYYSVPKLLSLLTFYLYLTIHLIQKINKTITYFAMICFINKENSITTYNFTCLNKYFE
jgi:hypothetical protein